MITKTIIKDAIRKIWLLYYDGFRSMTLGKSLWVLIFVKLFLIFIVMKFLFFPNLLTTNFDNDKERSEYVRGELTDRTP